MAFEEKMITSLFAIQTCANLANLFLPALLDVGPSLDDKLEKVLHDIVVPKTYTDDLKASLVVLSVPALTGEPRKIRRLQVLEELSQWLGHRSR